MHASKSRWHLGVLDVVLLVVAISVGNTPNTWAQSNPVPLIDQPLVSASIAPGGPNFTLTVNGDGFVPASVVQWNGSDLATSFVSALQLTAAVPAADIAAAGTASITVVNPGPGGGASNVVFLPITLATSSTTFSRSDVLTASGPETIATGDFNADGKMDMAVAVYGSGQVSVLLGNGNGTFQPHVDYATGTTPSSVVARDFNGDGKLDLAVLNQGSGTISFFLGKGDGTFQPAAHFATASSEGRMIAGDFNGDGKLDLARTDGCCTATVSILLGNGDGTFQKPIDYATGSSPYPIAVGDLNGDGKLDLVVGNTAVGTFSVLLGNGDGTFQTHSDYPTIPNPHSVVLADFNGDGKLDLAVSSEVGAEAPGLSILLGNGDGTFHNFANYATGCGGGNDCTATVADLNGDGKLDLAVRNNLSNTVSVLLGNGDGTFQSPLSFATGPDPEQVTVGDFNGDGKLDLVVANLASATVSVLLQTSGSAVSLSPSSLNFGAQLINITSGPKTVTLTNTGNATLDISSIGITGPSASFSQTNNCGSSLLAGASCAIAVTFRPTKTSTCAETAYLTVTDSGGVGTVKLSGAGTVMTLSVKSLNFGDQAVGTTSAAKTITLTNHATSRAVSVEAIGISGLNSPAFAQTNTCGTSLAAGASCTVSVTFTPHGKGSKAATLNVWNNGGAAALRVSLTGNGT